MIILYDINLPSYWMLLNTNKMMSENFTDSIYLI